MKKFVLMIFFLVSCSSINHEPIRSNNEKIYTYSDASGNYLYIREQKVINKRIVTRTQISINKGGSIKPLEKSVMISQMGTIKDKKQRILVVRPFASEFTVWLEGKSYDSKMRLDQKTQSMIIDLNSPEAKWNGKSTIHFPKGKQFCFFSQIPDCLYHNLFLAGAMANKSKAFSFYIVWDGYPFIQDQLNDIGSKLFTPAILKYESEEKSILKFEVEVNGQTILYHFSKAFDLVRMLWITQGISILPLGEELNAEE